MNYKNVCAYWENFLKREFYHLTKTKTGYPSMDMNHEEGSSFFERHPLIPNVDIITLLKLLSRNRLDDLAIDCDDIKVTYRQLFADAHLMYKAFKNLGVKKGDIVTIPLNDYHGIVACLGLNELGAVATLIDTYSTRAEIISFLNNYKSTLLINLYKSDEDNDYFLNNSSIRNVINLHAENENSRNYSLLGESNGNVIDFHSLGSYAKKELDLFHLPNSGNDLALILYTSGSSGDPKAVPLTNANIIAAQIYAGNTSHTENIVSNKTMVCVPLRYPYGMSTSLLTSLLWGKEAVMTTNWSKATAKYYLDKGANIIFGSPSVLDVVESVTPEDYDLSHISHFISGGDFLTEKREERAYDFFKKHNNSDYVEIGNGFGNAENVSLCSTPVGVPMRKGTAGKILVGTIPMVISADIPDTPIEHPEDLLELPYGEVGELCISGANVFSGYYGDVKRTSRVLFTKGGRTFLRTGTIGYITEEGYFVPTERKSRFYIKDTGHKVYLDHAQNSISTSCSDIVEECATVSLPDDDERFVTVAYVKMRCGVFSEEEVKRSIYDKLFLSLKEYEIPKFIFFIDEIPRIPGSQKTDYLLLEKRVSNDVDSQKKYKKEI